MKQINRRLLACVLAFVMISAQGMPVFALAVGSNEILLGEGDFQAAANAVMYSVDFIGLNGDSMLPDGVPILVPEEGTVRQQADDLAAQISASFSWISDSASTLEKIVEPTIFTATPVSFPENTNLLEAKVYVSPEEFSSGGAVLVTAEVIPSATNNTQFKGVELRIPVPDTAAGFAVTGLDADLATMELKSDANGHYVSVMIKEQHVNGAVNPWTFTFSIIPYPLGVTDHGKTWEVQNQVWHWAVSASEATHISVCDSATKTVKARASFAWTSLAKDPSPINVTGIEAAATSLDVPIVYTIITQPAYEDPTNKLGAVYAKSAWIKDTLTLPVGVTVSDINQIVASHGGVVAPIPTDGPNGEKRYEVTWNVSSADETKELSFGDTIYGDNGNVMSGIRLTVTIKSLLFDGTFNKDSNERIIGNTIEGGITPVVSYKDDSGASSEAEKSISWRDTTGANAGSLHKVPVSLQKRLDDMTLPERLSQNATIAKSASPNMLNASANTTTFSISGFQNDTGVTLKNFTVTDTGWDSEIDMQVGPMHLGAYSGLVDPGKYKVIFYHNGAAVATYSGNSGDPAYHIDPSANKMLSNLPASFDRIVWAFGDVLPGFKVLTPPTLPAKIAVRTPNGTYKNPVSLSYQYQIEEQQLETYTNEAEASVTYSEFALATGKILKTDSNPTSNAGSEGGKNKYFPGDTVRFVINVQNTSTDINMVNPIIHDILPPYFAGIEATIRASIDKNGINYYDANFQNPTSIRSKITMEFSGDDQFWIKTNDCAIPPQAWLQIIYEVKLKDRAGMIAQLVKDGRTQSEAEQLVDSGVIQMTNTAEGGYVGFPALWVVNDPMLIVPPIKGKPWVGIRKVQVGQAAWTNGSQYEGGTATYTLTARAKAGEGKKFDGTEVVWVYDELPFHTQFLSSTIAPQWYSCTGGTGDNATGITNPTTMTNSAVGSYERARWAFTMPAEQTEWEQSWTVTVTLPKLKQEGDTNPLLADEFAHNSNNEWAFVNNAAIDYTDKDGNQIGFDYTIGSSATDWGKSYNAPTSAWLNSHRKDGRKMVRTSTSFTVASPDRMISVKKTANNPPAGQTAFKPGDIVKYTIRLENKQFRSVFVNGVVDYLPPYMDYVAGTAKVVATGHDVALGAVTQTDNKVLFKFAKKQEVWDYCSIEITFDVMIRTEPFTNHKEVSAVLENKGGFMLDNAGPTRIKDNQGHVQDDTTDNIDGNAVTDVFAYDYCNVKVKQEAIRPGILKWSAADNNGLPGAPVSSSAVYSGKETMWWGVAVTNYDSTQNMNGFTVVDRLPAGFEYLGETRTLTGRNTGGSGDFAPLSTVTGTNVSNGVTVSHDGSTGDTILTYTTNTILQGDGSQTNTVWIFFKVQVPSGFGEYTNKALLYPNETFYDNSLAVNSRTQEPAGNPMTDGSAHYISAVGTLSVYGVSGMRTYKQVSGVPYNSTTGDQVEYTGNEDYVTVLPSVTTTDKEQQGVVTFTLNLVNTGSQYQRDIVFIDKLPCVNDTGVVTGQPRYSKFRPTLVAGSVSVSGTGTILGDAPGDPVATTPVVEYNTRTNFSKTSPDWLGANVSGNGSGWSSTFDDKTVGSMRITMPTAYVLAPGKSIAITFKMRIPYDTSLVKSKVPAYNSFAVRSNVYSGQDRTTQPDEYVFEPVKVGVATVFNRLGDYVWFDDNHNGIQDELPSRGINGVTVELYDAAGKTKLRVTTTKNDVNGNPGYYYFDKLNPNESYVVRFQPTVKDNAGNEYALTLQNQSKDGLSAEESDKLDSDPSPATGFTKPYYLGAEDEDLSIDAGYWREAPPATNDIEVTKALYKVDGSTAYYNGETVNIHLYKGATAPTAMSTPEQTKPLTLSDGSNKVVFEALNAGTYWIGEEYSPKQYKSLDLGSAAYASLTLSNGNVMVYTQVEVTAADTAVKEVSFRNRVTNLLGDYVWLDDGDGIQNDGATGVDGVTVTLLKPDGTTATKVTGSPHEESKGAGEPYAVNDPSKGYYWFADLEDGDYYIQFPTTITEHGELYKLTQKDAGGNDALDSDAGSTDGKTVKITVRDGKIEGQYINLTYDAGYVEVFAEFELLKQDKTGPGGWPVKNAVFSLTTKGTAQDGSTPTFRNVTTGADGKVKFTGLKIGTYTLKEESVPAPYVKANPDTWTVTAKLNAAGTAIEVSVTDANDKVVTEIVNAQLLGDFELVKQDKAGTGGWPVQGAVFSLTVKGTAQDGSTPTFQNATTGADGKVKFTGLKVGTYTLKEESVPAPYVKATPDTWTVMAKLNAAGTAIEVVVTDANEKVITEIVNAQSLGELEFLKRDQLAADVNGAKFQLKGTAADGSSYERIATSESGKVKFTEIKLGTYKLTETEAPQGYVKQDQEWTVNAVWDATAKKIVASILNPDPDAEAKTIDTIKNERILGAFDILKRGNESATTLLSGAEFTLYKQDGTTKVQIKAKATDILWPTANPVTTDATGRVSFKDLDEGSYILKETKAPAGYYLDGTETWAVKVDAHGTVTGTGIVKSGTGPVFHYLLTVTNKRIALGELLLKKVAKGTTTGLAGAEFRLSGTNYDMTGRTGADGTLKFTGIPTGTYALTETVAPEGYQKLTTTWTVVVKEDGSTTVNGVPARTAAYQIENTPVPDAGFEVLKVRADAGAVLAGATFTLVGITTGVSVSVTTGADGIAEFTGLKAGIYQLTETKAPNGFVKTNSTWIITVAVDGTITGTNMIGKRITVYNAAVADATTGGGGGGGSSTPPGSGSVTLDANAIPLSGGLPGTGDTRNRALAALLAVLAGGGLVAFAVVSKRKRRKGN